MKKLTPERTVQIAGSVIALAATCGVTPSVVVVSLTGNLWTKDEADQILKATDLFRPLQGKKVTGLYRDFISAKLDEGEVQRDAAAITDRIASLI